jgi:hypothetical protein
MSRIVKGRRVSAGTSAALLAIALVCFGRVGGEAHATDALPYSRGFLVTGNYVVGGVDLTDHDHPADENGLSTGTVRIAGCPPSSPHGDCVPADSDIVAAYLYWETITTTADPTQARGVRFRGQELLLNDVVGVKASSQPLLGSTASCWSSGSPLMMIGFRADVLRFLPIRMDADNKPTGKRLVTDADLTAHGLPLHTVTLPTRGGNQIPESAGASLVVVYRHASQPLRKIVLYDGLHIQPSLSATMTQTLQGFYKSSSSKSAKITHILASGQPNKNERIFFSNGTVAQISDYNPLASGSSSQRGWGNLTYNVSNLMNPGNNSAGGFGETASTSVSHAPGGGYDCLAWSAVVFSTAVSDRDRDGLPDGLEDSAAGLKDPRSAAFPTGEPLPNLSQMGASSSRKDLFVEINAMRTLTAKMHGSAGAPYDGAASPPVITKDVPAHSHMPTPEVLKLVGDGLVANGITPHFDVGNITDYHGLGIVGHKGWVDDYTSLAADHYLVPTPLAQGGEVVDERACNPSIATCQFPAFPGTVSWKVGLQLYRDAPVGNEGEELASFTPPPDWSGRRRFDRNRKGLFHYVFYAHYRGRPRSDLPCLDTSTDPDTAVPFPNESSCSGDGIIDNPDFRVPSSASGVADLPGGNAMITLGFWDEHVGTPFVRASTTFHELGHNFNLWHGGLPAVWGNKALNTSTLIEPNCKPGYPSSMSYLFQVHGLYDDNDEIHLDFSGTAHDNIGEASSPSDLALDPLPTPLYRTAWFAPAKSALANSLGASAARRYCNGGLFDANAPAPLMARVSNDFSADPIDWNGDGIINAADRAQDVNFDNALSTTLFGYDDWANIRLDQISAGRNAVKFQGGDFLDFGSGDFLDFGSGDFLDFGSGDFLDFGSGDFLDFGSGAIFEESSGDFIDFGSGDFIDFGSGDFLDFGSGDFLDFGSGSERQELDFETAKALGRGAPYALKACVIGTPGCVPAEPFTPLYHRIDLRWQAPPLGDVFLYHVSRKRGDARSSFPYVAPQPSSTSAFTAFVDVEQLPNDILFTYRVRAEFQDGTPRELSAFSRPVTVRAINNPPIAVADNYTTRKNQRLVVAAAGVLVNDTDPDSPPSILRAVKVKGPSCGTLVLNADGSFTYTPQTGFTGTDTFTYLANNGVWSADPAVPISRNSNVVTVTIRVTK